MSQANKRRAAQIKKAKQAGRYVSSSDLSFLTSYENINGVITSSDMSAHTTTGGCGSDSTSDSGSSSCE